MFIVRMEFRVFSVFRTTTQKKVQKVLESAAVFFINTNNRLLFFAMCNVTRLVIELDSNVVHSVMTRDAPFLNGSGL